MIIFLIFYLVIVILMIGLVIDRYLLVKFFLCYELFFFTISVLMLIYCWDINVMIIIFYLLCNSAFELILGLSILIIH